MLLREVYSQTLLLLSVHHHQNPSLSLKLSIFPLLSKIQQNQENKSGAIYSFMDSEQPDPKSINLSDPKRLLPEDEISKTQDDAKKECFQAAGPPEMSSSSSATEVSGSENVDDDNNGFRTPVKHRIPVITECPPAPKKTRIPLLKRKALKSPTASRNRIQIKLTEAEFEALFPPKFNDFRGKIKKEDSTDGAV